SRRCRGDRVIIVVMLRHRLVHDPMKWIPVFQRDHAPQIKLERGMTIEEKSSRSKAQRFGDMAVSEFPAGRTTQAASSLHNLLLATFFAVILTSAALLFAVQPMFTKMVLPRLGGAAAVWSVAMVFFQATLLAGYAYAHLLTRFAPGRGSVLIHLAVLLIACF